VFKPGEVEAFEFRNWHYFPESGCLQLGYALRPGPVFTETIVFPKPSAWPANPARRRALAAAFGLLHAIAGVSYYKCACPPLVTTSGCVIDADLARFLRRVYRNGLAEFACRNALQLPEMEFEQLGGPSCAAIPPLKLQRRSLVPLGGGKDSLVSVELLREMKQALCTAVVGNSPVILGTAQRAGLELVQIRRKLDRGLFVLNETGAYNGHVPITAIVSAIMLAAAVLYDFDSVVMSNEASADEPNLYRDGQPVNHQWSKGSEFEREFSALVTARIGAGIHYFSLLRPLSEMAIIRRFAKHTQYHAHFSSCNRNFHIHADAPISRWCGDCPKCRFVFLGLATVLKPADLVQIFHRNLLDESAQIPGFKALTGLLGHKPFECVGTCDESIAAFAELRQLPAWRDCAVVRAIGDLLGRPSSQTQQQAVYDGTCIPKRFRYAL